MPNLRVVVLASGTGTLFEALANRANEIGIEVVGLIADAKVAACERATSLDIPVTVLPMNVDRSTWDERLATELNRLKPELIVSAGFMKILGPRVLENYLGRIINTHPALLPLFPGAHAVRDALKARVTVTGATVHFVDEGIDTGKIITSQQVRVEPDDTEALLHERIKVVERELLIAVVRDFANGNFEFGDVVN
ncbi:MAG: phosphoribosylglycinamide formyltransferase [Candidatus Nanopelagicales bacterium]|nr:phosphoribosylglycinamide formyltransferase [Candidatus Nanopelagicales bacterium]